jgi:anti-sigma B factor antagonist
MSTGSQPPKPEVGDDATFACDVEPERDAVRIRTKGSLDLAKVPELEGQLDELRAAGFRRLILDLSSLEFMDSTGLRLVLLWAADAQHDGYALELVPGPPAVQQVFEISGTAASLPFVGT